MVTAVLFLMLVLMAALLAAFIYQIVTTRVVAVDAPTLIKSRAAPPAPASALPARQPRAHAATAPRTVSPEASRRLRSQAAAVLAIAGVAAILVGGWLFHNVAHGGAACSHQAIEVCSQGSVLLTGTQLVGGAIAMGGICSVVIASVLALR